MKRSALAVRMFLACLPLVVVVACRRSESAEVIVYTSVDQVTAARVFDLFTSSTGIRVKAVYDTEAGKTTGLFRRLMAERDRPLADVFWNGEICRTIQLADAGVAADIRPLAPADIPRRWVDPEGRWVGFSLRARVIVYNTNLIKRPVDAPQGLDDLLKPEWGGKVVMANPLFGTTATHVAAMYETLGAEEAEKYLMALKANGLRLVEGNSVVRDVVARGEMAVGLTDTDDVFAGMAEGMPIAFILPDQTTRGTFVIPNSVMRVAGGPNPEAARKFIRFLLSREIERELAFARARQIPVRADVRRPDELMPFDKLRVLEVDYNRVAGRLHRTETRMEAIFLTGDAAEEE